MPALKITLSGYGKMGKEIEKIALQKGHSVVCKIDNETDWENCLDSFKTSDVLIDFSIPKTAYNNIRRALQQSIPVVSGTTGWLDDFEKIAELVEDTDGAFFYASNFSIGMNILFALNTHLAEIMNTLPQYEPHINETHHIHKVDAPSGSAITLANGILGDLDRKDDWSLNCEKQNCLQVNSMRIGEVNGEHSVVYTSEDDILKLEHEALSRKAFSKGAVLAAEWLIGKYGIFSMQDLLNIKQ